MPPPPPMAGSSFFGASATIASVMIIRPAMDCAALIAGAYSFSNLQGGYDMSKASLALATVLSLPLMGALAVTPAFAQSASETRILKGDILKHPIAEVAVRYAEAVHAGKQDDMLNLTSATGQKTFKADPPGEQQASMRFLKKFIPAPAALKVGIESGGILILEGSTATLNVVTTQSQSTKPGEVTSDSTTTAMPFLLEDGVWKIAR